MKREGAVLKDITMTISAKDVETLFSAIKESTYVCDLCGKIIYPTITAKNDKINISSDKNYLVGARNELLFKNVCKFCRNKCDSELR